MFSAFVYLCIFPCDICVSCALLVHINKKMSLVGIQIGLWKGCQPFSLHLFQKSKELLGKTNGFMDSVNCWKDQNTVCWYQTLHFVFTFLSSLEVGKDHMEKAMSLREMDLCLADLWLLQTTHAAKCSRLEQDFSLKDCTCNTCFRVPLSSFVQVLLLFWDC